MRRLYPLILSFLVAGVLAFAQDSGTGEGATGEPAIADAIAEPVAGESGAGEAGAPDAAVEVFEGASWGGTIPEVVRRPNRGSEAIRYPEDVVIGSLGKGEASGEAYTFARSVLDALIRRNAEDTALSGIGPAWLDEIFAALEPVSAVKYRIGSGREEADGSTSFLFRFIGREQGVAGEFYVRKDENDTWQFEDILLEDPHATTKRIEPYSYDFTPYERFF
jgi:hypothetical protein